MTPLLFATSFSHQFNLWLQPLDNPLVIHADIDYPIMDAGLPTLPEFHAVRTKSESSEVNRFGNF